MRDPNEETLDWAQGRLDETAFRRARHVISENRRTLEAADALAAGDYAGLGLLMRQSQKSQQDDFEITVPATQQLAGIMNEAIGPEGGARQTGGGFGGAVIGLMRRDRAKAVSEHVAASYRSPLGEPPHIVIEEAHAGVSAEIGTD